MGEGEVKRITAKQAGFYHGETSWVRHRPDIVHGVVCYLVGPHVRGSGSGAHATCAAYGENTTVWYCITLTTQRVSPIVTCPILAGREGGGGGGGESRNESRNETTISQTRANRIVMRVLRSVYK